MVVTVRALVVAAAAVAAVALFLAAERERAARETRLAAEAGRVAADYGATLLGAVKGAIETSGLVGAIGFCKEQAPAIAAEQSQRTGWRIARTSLKPRNPASAPDDFERAAMADFAARIAQGEAVAAQMRSATVETAEGPLFRFVKAIPTGEPCLACHGATLKPDVAAALKQLYPEDTATGFKAGDMRGVFTLARRP
ncbi:DUF3365 domain-containing protein [Rhodoplanes sp. TEM]|uniref:DUF3365 domain-containing protein n=1 Tax=Rhodoplanes tepidamans TaxID=200616 RepID=A0ABT5JFI2_RHOTP|nr:MULTISPECIES: DUF3365 domain-containing protein [Rhodoplanes]MDC7788178.1 DUF3365 domain-containing protein [Rhodoplanes tepidamans]MDC7986513.1 DUF3365 domain-containing protein [Rhodoplanes sp. TEM]MDQ0355132.1 hypothetical protein [Rhodoplanes tepidamans]